MSTFFVIVFTTTIEVVALKYNEVIAEMIDKSGLKLKEIAEQCKEHGVNIDSSYLSKLQTGKQPPASDDVNRAVALVCNGDYETLYHAKNMEKTPDYIRSFVEKMIPFFRTLSIQSVPEFLRPFLEKEMKEQSDFSLIKHFLEQQLPIVSENGILSIKNDNDTLMEYQFFKNTVRILDNSMEPRIPKDAKLEIGSKEGIVPGDIVAVKLKDGSGIIRRYFLVDNKTILIPDNLSYESLVYEQDQVEILGKIVSVVIDL